MNVWRIVMTAYGVGDDIHQAMESVLERLASEDPGTVLCEDVVYERMDGTGDVEQRLAEILLPGAQEGEA